MALKIVIRAKFFSNWLILNEKGVFSLTTDAYKTKSQLISD